MTMWARPVGSPTRETGHGEPQPASGVAQVAVGSDEDDVGPGDDLGRREMDGVVPAEVVVVREHPGSRREDGRHGDPIKCAQRPSNSVIASCSWASVSRRSRRALLSAARDSGYISTEETTLRASRQIRSASLDPGSAITNFTAAEVSK